MFDLCSLIQKAVKDFLKFRSFSSKYFYIQNVFLISLYAFNFDIFPSDFIRCSQNCSYLSVNLFLFTITMKQNYKYYGFPKYAKNLNHIKVIFFTKFNHLLFELLHCSQYTLLTSELSLDCTICNQKFIQLT